MAEAHSSLVKIHHDSLEGPSKSRVAHSVGQRVGQPAGSMDWVHLGYGSGGLGVNIYPPLDVCNPDL